MLFVKFLLCLAVTSLVVASPAAKFKFMSKRVPRKDFVQVKNADANTDHELVFAVKQKNLAEMDRILMELSTPGSPRYQQWLNFDEVGAITSNVEGAKAVEDWLAENNIEVTWKSAHSDYIKATAKISQWEQMLDTKFFVFEDHSRIRKVDASKQQQEEEDHRMVHRAVEYSLPEHVSAHLSTVFNTVQVPPVLHQKYRTITGEEPKQFKEELTFSLRKKHDKKKEVLSVTPVTVAFLNDLYGMEGLSGSSSQKQSVFETNGQSFSPNDLTQFQNMYDLHVQSASAPYGLSTSDCSVSGKCDEGNLDVQYIMGISPMTATIYWYVPSTSQSDPFVTYVTDVSNSANPPWVNSISWGSTEQDNDPSVMDQFNTEAMKLGTQGITVMVSSGDNGVAGDEDSCNVDSSKAQSSWPYSTTWTGKGYFPSFPATSPYVTAVGATQGPEQGGPEIACQSQKSGVITTGGGFSTYYPAPSWQRDTIFNYLDQYNANPGYNANGRAYPDVSMIGVYYQVVIQGVVGSIFGTSASAPVFAGMVSLLNAARASEGKARLGFLNPSLYNASAVAYFNDVTSGNNNCTSWGEINNPSGATCCSSGFSCVPGWDPVTGHGSIDYINLKNMFDGFAPVYKNSASGAAGVSLTAVAGIALAVFFHALAWA